MLPSLEIISKVSAHKNVVGPHVGSPLADRDLETRFPNGVQVVGEPLGELLDGAHVEGEAEVLGQAV